ncbi:MAG TPA: hypothetical protein VGZ29_05765 [Terriglobia bacterium]|nr:hypothetical protein [Terriglobia bacterium]
MSYKLAYTANGSNVHLGTGFLFVNVLPPLFDDIPLNDGNNPPSYVDPPTPATWTATHAYTAGQYVADATGNTVQKCTTAGTSGSSVPTFNTTVGGTTTDSAVTWTCVGPQIEWVASLPVVADAVVRDSLGSGGGTGLVHICVSPGTSASSAPTWSTVIGGYTVDGSVIWQCCGPTFAVGAMEGAVEFAGTFKKDDINADQFTAPIDAVITAETMKINGTLKELTITNLANLLPNFNPLTGQTNPNLPANAQNYEASFFGGRQAVPKFSVACFSPRRLSANPTKYFTAWCYKGAPGGNGQFGFTRTKETTWKIEIDGLASLWRPAGYQVGGNARQT